MNKCGIVCVTRKPRPPFVLTMCVSAVAGLAPGDSASLERRGEVGRERRSDRVRVSKAVACDQLGGVRLLAHEYESIRGVVRDL